jgi:hypothetical protein
MEAHRYMAVMVAMAMMMMMARWELCVPILLQVNVPSNPSRLTRWHVSGASVNIFLRLGGNGNRNGNVPPSDGSLRARHNVVVG